MLNPLEILLNNLEYRAYQKSLELNQWRQIEDFSSAEDVEYVRSKVDEIAKELLTMYAAMNNIFPPEWEPIHV